MPDTSYTARLAVVTLNGLNVSTAPVHFSTPQGSLDMSDFEAQMPHILIVNASIALLKWTLSRLYSPILVPSLSVSLQVNYQPVSNATQSVTFALNPSLWPTQFTLAGLTPFTPYEALVSLVSAFGERLQTRAAQFATAECAPALVCTPRVLYETTLLPAALHGAAAGIERTRVELSLAWNPPGAPNGVLTRFELRRRTLRTYYELYERCSFRQLKPVNR